MKPTITTTHQQPFEEILERINALSWELQEEQYNLARHGLPYLLEHGDRLDKIRDVLLHGGIALGRIAEQAQAAGMPILPPGQCPERADRKAHG